MRGLEELESKIGIKFTEPSYLEQALTHASFANEQGGGHQSNERLEFLGDAVLELAVSELLYHRYPELSEGALTKRRAALVCEATLEQCARQLELGSYLRLGKGEELSGGRERPALLADALEALLGAIFLDQGLEAARDFVAQILGSRIEGEEELFFDYKTQLQEALQRYRNYSLKYNLLAADGPDHNKTFRVGVMINGQQVAVGVGRSKKEAEQAAAQQALTLVAEKHGL
ncbi:MAG: ribonuclease III [bacterium]|jgi:ribonuclease-3|nr:ribonuclease III [Bacillota bacterium]HHW54222.1 ribonuclease III [Bacillota bacterium]